jgi:hypothetical protein
VRAFGTYKEGRKEGRKEILACYACEEPGLVGTSCLMPSSPIRQRAVMEIQPLDSPEIADIIDIARW